MFSSLVASVLLATSVATPTLKAQNLQPRYANGINALGGGYVLKDYFNESDFVSNQSDAYNYVLGQPYGSYLYFNGGWSQCPNFKITYIAIDLAVPPIRNYIIDYEVGDDYTITIGKNTTLSNLDSTSQELIVYFPETIYVSNKAWQMFNALFTKTGNNYTKYYNGYYSYNKSMLNTNTDFNIFGYVMVNNETYNAFSYSIGESHADVINGDRSLVVVENGVLKVPNNFYFSGVLIPNEYYDNMLRVGIFAFQRDPIETTTDFEDLIFTAIDSPIYMLTRLLNFELFGMNLFIAFSGLLTIVVIVVLIKRFF